MNLSGLHLLLTYQCTFECDHCFVWGSPNQNGTMTFQSIQKILTQCQEMDHLEWIYFEGGEPTLYYPLLLKGVQAAHALGFRIGIVSNAFWANSLEDARLWLEPFRGLVEDFSISSDLYHYNEMLSQQAQNAVQAARDLGIPIGVISIAQPESEEGPSQVGKLPEGVSAIMYRGRAAINLAPMAVQKSWIHFTSCPFEDLVEPGRLHVDPLGYVHICQGISIGNLFQTPLKQICSEYNPTTHPIIAPIMAGGPVELAQRYEIPVRDNYADACHLCYLTRANLREKYPEYLAPDQVYPHTI